MDDSSAVIGIVIPVFGHSALVAEAIVSAADQDFEGRIITLVVIDGDPHPETQRVVRLLARGGDRPVLAIYRPNGHLSAARNTGIELLLQREPDLDAIYFLDADNRLSPGSIRTFWRALRDNPQASWSYPDIGFVGLTWGAAAIDFRITAPQYDPLRHLMGNICEAGSMVRAEVFRSGLRFDETFRSGYEDWEFWLQCLGRGHIGTRAENTGFQYRRRSDSMLADADRTSDATKTRIHQKHAALYAPASVAEKFCDACAPYLLVSPKGKLQLLRADGEPFRDGSVSLEDLLALARNHFHFAYLPRYVITPIGASNELPRPSVEHTIALLTNSAPAVALAATRELEQAEGGATAHFIVHPVGLLEQAEDVELRALGQRLTRLEGARSHRLDQRYAGPASFAIDDFVGSLVLPNKNTVPVLEHGASSTPAPVNKITLLVDPSASWALHPFREIVESALPSITPMQIRHFGPKEIELTQFAGQPFFYYNRPLEFLSQNPTELAQTALVVSDTKTLFYIGELKRHAKTIAFTTPAKLTEQDFAAIVCSEHALSQIFCSSSTASRLRSAGVPERKLHRADGPETGRKRRLPWHS